MQTQDYKYITMKRVIEKNKIKRLQSQLHCIDKAKETKKNHIFFVDSGEGKKDVVKRIKKTEPTKSEVPKETDDEQVRYPSISSHFHF
jgi:hypothetical protein